MEGVKILEECTDMKDRDEWVKMCSEDLKSHLEGAPPLTPPPHTHTSNCQPCFFPPRQSRLGEKPLPAAAMHQPRGRPSGSLQRGADRFWVSLLCSAPQPPPPTVFPTVPPTVASTPRSSPRPQLYQPRRALTGGVLRRHGRRDLRARGEALGRRVTLLPYAAVPPTAPLTAPTSLSD